MRQVERVVGTPLQLLAIVVGLFEVVDRDAFQLRELTLLLFVFILLALLVFRGVLLAIRGGGFCIDTRIVIIV